MTDELARLSSAARALSEAKNLDEVTHIRDIAKAASAYAQAAKLGLQAQNDAIEVQLLAERKAGEMLAEMPKATGGGDTSGGSLVAPPQSPPTLNELGISKKESSRFQKLADIPEPEFQKRTQAVKARGEKLTTAAVLKPNVHFSTETDEWTTPPEIIELVDQVIGPIDLDPCSNRGVPNVPAHHHLTKEHDGLSLPWLGNVYMNPPYGHEIGEWTSKLAAEFEAGNTKEAIALVPSRTDTAWFRELRSFPRCFIWGRLKFGNGENSAPFPSMAVYFGSNPRRFVELFSSVGDIYEWSG